MDRHQRSERMRLIWRRRRSLAIERRGDEARVPPTRTALHSLSLSAPEESNHRERQRTTLRNGSTRWLCAGFAVIVATEPLDSRSAASLADPLASWLTSVSCFGCSALCLCVRAAFNALNSSAFLPLRARAIRRWLAWPLLQQRRRTARTTGPTAHSTLSLPLARSLTRLTVLPLSLNSLIGSTTLLRHVCRALFRRGAEPTGSLIVSFFIAQQRARASIVRR